MLFNSIEFILFLAAAFLSYHLIPLQVRKYHLLIFSYLFYFSWSIKYAVLLACVTGFTYMAAIKISKAGSEESMKRFLWISVTCLIGILVFFRYFPFSVFAAGRGGLGEMHPLVVPLGISYYTFKLISYIVDVYWKKNDAERDFISFAAYVAFFPQILSGPIQRAGHFLTQIKKPEPVKYPVLVSGLRLILFGFFKKLVIADRLALFVNTVYDSPAIYHSFVLLMAAYGFMFQLYADFSGLTDIARGSARLFGIESPWNFNLPFFSSNLQQYWRRWHATLTNWLSDYVFKPLHMSLRNWGSWGMAAAVMVNMTLIGLWHGASLNYLVFGLIHGVFMVVSVLTLNRRSQFFKHYPQWVFLRSCAAPLITFHLVVFASVFFRSESLPQAFLMISHIADFNLERLGANFFPRKDMLIIALGIILMETAHYLQKNNQFKVLFYRKPLLLRWAVYYGCFAGIMIFGQFASLDFIYFKF